MLSEIADGRTDLVFEFIAEGNGADYDGRQWSFAAAVVCVLRRRERDEILAGEWGSLDSLGDNLDLNAACFHGHWRLCKFLLEQGADVNLPLAEYWRDAFARGALHYEPASRTTWCCGYCWRTARIPNCATKPNVETGGFMRDCRTKGETPLHRAAAFGDRGKPSRCCWTPEPRNDAKDINGDSPLSWASWHARPMPKF